MSQSSKSWGYPLTRRNISAIVVTFDVSQSDRSRRKLTAPSNMLRMFTTALVRHRPMSPLKLRAYCGGNFFHFF